MEVRNNADVSFGWLAKDHRKMASRNIKRYFPELLEFRQLFRKFVQRPDVDELGPMGNWHFYNRHSKKSYLDYRGKNNAHARYQFHVQKMFEAVKEKNILAAIEHAARAIHFGQDMAQPHHTQKGLFFNKVWAVPTHVSFEQFAQKMKKGKGGYLKSFIAPLKEKSENLPTAKDFDDLFMKTVIDAELNTAPTKKNIPDWDDIARKGIHQAMTFTYKFMDLFSNLLDAKNLQKEMKIC